MSNVLSKIQELLNVDLRIISQIVFIITLTYVAFTFTKLTV